MQHRLILALTCAASPALSAPLTLQLPQGADQIGIRADAPAEYAMPIAGFDGKQVPVRVVQGALDQRAYRLGGTRDNTLALMLPLSDQLAKAGYTPIYQCATTACGGFDFRFALDVLPEPQMHVDLGDFRYLAAMDRAGDAVTLLISRSADQAFVQVTSVTVGGMTGPVVMAPPSQPEATATVQPDQPATDIVTPDPDPALDPDPAPEARPVAAASGTMGDRLLTTGSVALDDLIFPPGKAALQDTDYASLAELADWLKANPTLVVTLVGHTDATGSLAGNVALSKKRAQSVRDWLIRHYGASARQMGAEGAGYLAPRATNQTPEGQAQNRRVEVMLTSTPQL